MSRWFESTNRNDPFAFYRPATYRSAQSSREAERMGPRYRGLVGIKENIRNLEEYRARSLNLCRTRIPKDPTESLTWAFR